MSTPDSDSIATRLQQVRVRIAAAEAQAGRAPGSVRLLAVSKTFPAAAVAAAAAAGQLAFGENYVQEAVAKMGELAGQPLEWHCIGPLQSRKSGQVAAHFDWSLEEARKALEQLFSTGALRKRSSRYRLKN